MKKIAIILIASFIFTLGLCAYKTFQALTHPIKYENIIETWSKEFSIPSYIIASVINVESSYDEKAVSSKGAVGLMQIMPSTAEWISKLLGKEYSDENLLEANFNIEIGTYYLSYLKNYFKSEELALCAYNAGQGNVKNWLNNTEYSQDGKTLIKIPFEETKNYLNKVYKNYHYYKNKYK